MSKIDLNEVSEMQFDILAEIGNIGAGNATTALSQMMNQKLDMRVPQVELLPFDSMSEKFGGEESILVGIMLGLEGIAAGAAAVGCCAQMVGFAVTSFKSNGVGGLISQGIGISMLQFGNIMRHPQIALAPTLAGAVLGPVSTCLLKMTNTPSGAGMGTSGLVGQFGAYSAMAESFGSTKTILFIAVMHVVAPALLSLIFHFIFKKIGLVKDEYLKLEKI